MKLINITKKAFVSIVTFLISFKNAVSVPILYQLSNAGQQPYDFAFIPTNLRDDAQAEVGGTRNYFLDGFQLSRFHRTPEKVRDKFNPLNSVRIARNQGDEKLVLLEKTSAPAENHGARQRVPPTKTFQPQSGNREKHFSQDIYNSHSQYRSRYPIPRLYSSRSDINPVHDGVKKSNMSGPRSSAQDSYFDFTLRTGNRHTERSRATYEKKLIVDSNHFEMPIFNQPDNLDALYQQKRHKKATYPSNDYYDAVPQEIPNVESTRILADKTQNLRQRENLAPKKIVDLMYAMKTVPLTDSPTSKVFNMPSCGSSSPARLLIELDVSEACDTYETYLEIENGNSLFS